jgi:phage terminase small subunit
MPSSSQSSSSHPTSRTRRRNRTDDRHARFVAELLRNGGNASAAARAVGYHPDHGRRLVSRSATVSATLEEAQQRTEEELREWIELAPRAQQVLVELLDCGDDRVRFQAAVHIIDRALGKVPQKVEQRVEHRGVLSEIEMQAALSLIAAHGLAYVEAERYVVEHPDEVQEWARQNVAATSDQSSPVRQLGSGAMGNRQ